MNSLASRQPAWVNRSVVPRLVGRSAKVIRVPIHEAGPSVTRHTTRSGVSATTCMTAAGCRAWPKYTWKPPPAVCSPPTGHPVHQQAMPSVLAIRSCTRCGGASMLMRCRMSGIVVPFGSGRGKDVGRLSVGSGPGSGCGDGQRRNRGQRGEGDAGPQGGPEPGGDGGGIAEVAVGGEHGGADRDGEHGAETLGHVVDP